MTTTPAIKPIPTTYKGIEYRSRIEARWAVVLDKLGIPFQYEHEGFELPSGRYLPDFWLPTVDGGTWLEIKGQEPTQEEIRLMSELTHLTKKQGILAGGALPDPQGWPLDGQDGPYVWGAPSLDPEEPEWCFTNGYEDNNYMLTFCPHCGAPTFQFMGSVEYAGRHCGSEAGATEWAQTRLEAAFQAARSYRFWDPVA